MRDVAIIGAACAPCLPSYAGNEIELLLPVVQAAVRDSGVPRARIQFTTLASSDFWAGQAFAFVRALDAAGAYPVLDDSHVDMDGAFALYEAWVRIQTGEVDSALVYALGRSSSGREHEIGPLGLDPYTLAPLALDPRSVLALAARACLAHGVCTEAELHEVTRRNREQARATSWALVGDDEPEPAATPLATDDFARPCDGAAAVVLASGELARTVCERPVWIRGIDQRSDAHGLGVRALHASPSAHLAAARAGVAAGAVDVAELMCLAPHEERVLVHELGLSRDVRLNPSGSGWGGHPVMATGLYRFVAAVDALRSGSAHRALVHASAGPCLQQNLVAILEADHG